MANSEKNAKLAQREVEKNLSTIDEAHDSLDELKKNIIKTSNDFVSEVDALLSSLNDTREQISANTEAGINYKNQFDEVYKTLVK